MKLMENEKKVGFFYQKKGGGKKNVPLLSYIVEIRDSYI